MGFESAFTGQLSTAQSLSVGASEFGMAFIGGEFRQDRPNSGDQAAPGHLGQRLCSVAGEARVLEAVLVRSRALQAAFEGIAGHVLGSEALGISLCPNSPKIAAASAVDRCHRAGSGEGERRV